MAKLLSLAFWWCTVGLLATIAIDANPDEDLYAILGVERSATQREIKRKYRALARELHPDKYEAEDPEAAREQFQRVQALRSLEKFCTQPFMLLLYFPFLLKREYSEEVILSMIQYHTCLNLTEQLQMISKLTL